MKPTTLSREQLERVKSPVADTTELTAIPSKDILNLSMMAVGSPKAVYVYDVDDTSTADPGRVEVPDNIAASDAYIADPTTAPGRWTNVTALVAGGSSAGAGAGRFKALAATTANLAYTLDGNTLEADANGAQGAIDGVTLDVGKVLLVKNQSAGEANGLFVFTSMGGVSSKASMDRIDGFNSDAEALEGSSVFVERGTANGDQIWDLTTNGPITLGTTALTWTKRPTLAEFASTAAGKGSALVGSNDAGGFTDKTTTEEQVQEIYQHLKSTQHAIPIPITAALDAATGALLAVFADGDTTTPGTQLTNSKAAAVRWNNHATPGAIAITVPMPPDLDHTANLEFHALVSKIGATVGDATALTVGAFEQTVGALHDADADFGGDTNAVVGNAASKTVSELTLVLAHANVSAPPSAITLTIKPKDGTLGTDDFLLHAAWFERKPTLLTS